ncbi:unnamed protein product [Paramecium primaurelia]|uniref:RING-type domain-containing protein n=1 Tax=Paramecium primaurelia TaxID=5886 RepID=A0A8S1P9U8_PARPR|nr:unnamed protein product [Paramecium primaurelia]
MICQSQAFLPLNENQELEEQFYSYFPNGANWKTSQFFQDQTYEQFDSKVTTFFSIIGIQKNLANLNKDCQISQSNLFSVQFNKNDFSLSNMMEYLQSIASKLQISLSIIIMPKQIKQYGNIFHQQAKIIIQQTNNKKKLSFIFGLQSKMKLNQNPNFNMQPGNELNLEIQDLSQNNNIQSGHFFPNKNLNPFLSSQNIINQFKQQLSPPNINQNNNLIDQGSQQNQQFKMKCPQQNLLKNNQQIIFNNQQQHQQINPKQIKFINPQQQQQINPKQYRIDNIKLNVQQQPQKISKEIDESQTVLKTILIEQIETKQEKSNYNIFSKNEHQKSVTAICDICSNEYERISQQQIFLPCCQKPIHKKCFQEELQNLKEPLINIKCYFCHQNFQTNFIKENVDTNIFIMMVQNQLNLLCISECFNCKSKISILPEEKQKICKIECENCKTMICSQCMKNFHGFEKICQSVKQEVLKHLEGYQIIFCPFCDFIQTKDEGCNHVTCNKCKMDLCSVCSVDRRPILSHGNHFHRIGCSDHRYKEGQETMTKERIRGCQLCIQNPDKYCHIPIDLKTYKQEKGF